MSSKKTIEVSGLHLSYNDNVVLDGLDFDLLENEVHVILGQNATGKSSLVKILSGKLPPDSGNVVVNGRQLYKQPSRSNVKGLHVIYQGIYLFPNLTVMENVFFDKQGIFIQNKKHALEEYEKLSGEMDVSIPPDALVSQLSACEKRLVEIMKAYANNPYILILDEVTAFISNNEITKVNKALKKLKKAGSSILYITHKLNDALEIADRISIIYDNRIIKTFPASSETEDSMIKLMTGRSYKERYPKISFPQGGALLSANNITNSVLKGIDFTLHRGEILGITGIGGSGKSMLGRALVGRIPLDDGYVFHEPSGSVITSIAQANKLGVGYLSEEITNNIVPYFNAPKNISLPDLNRISPAFIIESGLEKQLGMLFMNRMHFPQSSTFSPTKYCSGGQQQVIALSKWLFKDCDILIIDEPTQYVDIPSKVGVYNIFNAFVSQNKGMILLTSDLSEACGMCDRTLVLNNGRIVGEFSRKEVNEEKIVESFFTKKSGSNA